MKKFLLSTTIALMAGLTVQAQNVSQADIEQYLQAHPEAIQTYLNSQQKQENLNAAIGETATETIAPQPAEPAMQQSALASQILATLATARQNGTIQQDGRFEIKEKEIELSGQLLCSDSELESLVNSLETEMNSANPDIEQLRKPLDKLLRCVSFSKLNIQDNGSTVTLTGGFKFPLFEDNSVISVKLPDKVFNITFGLEGAEQDVTINVRTNKGEKLSYISLQYDTDRLTVPFELGALSGLMSYIKGSDEQMIYQQMQRWAQENNLLAEKALRVKKAEIYQPDGKKVLIMNGEDEQRAILRLFSSVEREFFNAVWTDTLFKFNLSLPQSAKKILESEITFPPNFQENYRKFMQTVSQNPNRRPDAEIAQMLSGLKLETTLYGLDGQQLARLRAKLNNQITTPDRPEEVIDFATLSILKATPGCSVRSVSFAKTNPNVLTVCDSTGCSDQPLFQALVSLSPCLEQVAGAVLTKFTEEFKDELKTLEKVYIPGVSDGYNMAMSRYRSNEILNAAAMVSIMGMSKNGGMGGDADLSDLGGVQAMKLDEFISSDRAIRSDKNGLVTIEVKPEFAKELMPIIGDISGKRVTSGCTADTTTCVIDMAKSVK